MLGYTISQNILSKLLLSNSYQQEFHPCLPLLCHCTYSILELISIILVVKTSCDHIVWQSCQTVNKNINASCNYVSYIYIWHLLRLIRVVSVKPESTALEVESHNLNSSNISLNSSKFDQFRQTKTGYIQDFST